MMINAVLNDSGKIGKNVSIGYVLVSRNYRMYVAYAFIDIYLRSI